MDIDQDPSGDPMVIIRKAAAAAAKVLARTGTGTFNGKTSMEYGTEAWIYNQERGLSHEYTSRRAKFLVIEDMRKTYGRWNKKVQVHYRDSESCLFRSTPSRTRDIVPPNEIDRVVEAIDNDQFRVICECLLQGKNQTDAARILGVSPTRVSQIIRDHGSKLLPLLGMEN